MKDSTSVRQQAKSIQKAFKKLYFEWEIEHVRPLQNFVALTNDGPDNMLSRHEFTEAVIDHKYRAPAGIPTEYGRFVQTTGGFTRLTIIKPDGTKVVSKHNFSTHCNFFKALGFVKAAYKAAGAEITPIVEDMHKEQDNSQHVGDDGIPF